MNIDLKDLAARLVSLTDVLRKYVVLIFILSFLAVYGFLVLRVNTLSQVEPDEEVLTEKLSELKQPKIDQQIVEKIKQLEAQNIEVQTLFQQARDNPFSE